MVHASRRLKAKAQPNTREITRPLRQLSPTLTAGFGNWRAPDTASTRQSLLYPGDFPRMPGTDTLLAYPYFAGHVSTYPRSLRYWVSIVAFAVYPLGIS